MSEIFGDNQFPVDNVEAYLKGWNEAIEAAIMFMVTNRLEEGLYDRMRKGLKK